MTLPQSYYSEIGKAFIDIASRCDHGRNMYQLKKAAQKIPFCAVAKLFDEIHLTSDYTLDVCCVGNTIGGITRLYARKCCPDKLFIGKDDQSDGITYFVQKLAAKVEGNDSVKIKDPDNDFVYDPKTRIGGVISEKIYRKLPDYRDYITFDFNERAVWQLFLLAVIESIFPYYWHGAYLQRTYFLDKQSMIDFKTEMDDGVPRPKLTDYQYLMDTYPTINIIDKTQAEVKVVFWNDWQGLVLNTYIATNTNGKVDFKIDKSASKVLIEYDCQVVF